MTVIIDTGPIVAAASVKDQHHDACVAALRRLHEPPLITSFVVGEVCYFLNTRATPAAEASFLRSVVAGTFRLVEPAPADLERTAARIEQYADLPLGAADASVIAVAERFGIKTVLTLDQRHFRIVRPRHVGSFQLLP